MRTSHAVNFRFVLPDSILPGKTVKVKIDPYVGMTIPGSTPGASFLPLTIEQRDEILVSKKRSGKDYTWKMLRSKKKLMDG